jgi:hypothetical protein
VIQFTTIFKKYFYILSTLEGNGLAEMRAPNGTLIQFACAANQTVSNDLFTKHLLKNITKKNENITDVFEAIVNDVYEESRKSQQPQSMNGLLAYPPVYLNAVKSCTYRVKLKLFIYLFTKLR